jgi:hypothetical protein
MLPKEVQERIKKEALALMNDEWHKQPFSKSNCYIMGATAEAERSQKLVGLLQRVADAIELQAGTSETVIEIRKTLAEYNQQP